MSEPHRGCEAVVNRLVAALRKGEDVSADDRQHLATCPECKGLLAAVRQLDDALEADTTDVKSEEQFGVVARKAEAAARRAEWWRRATFLILGAAAILIPWLMVPQWTSVRVLGVVVGLGAVGTLIVQRLNASAHGVKLYKRLKGQWVFGVCRGLAEAGGIPVLVLRGAFVALMVAGKTGVMIAIVLYLLLDMSLEVHPEDRGMLLRFRLKRWLARHRPRMFA